MRKRYDEKYEENIRRLAEGRLSSKNYKIFDVDARIIKRERIYGLASEGRTSDSNCLVITNREGETIVLTQEFEQMLFNVLKNKS